MTPREEMERALRLKHAPGAIIEIRAPQRGGKRFTSYEEAADYAFELTQQRRITAVWHNLNPIDPEADIPDSAKDQHILYHEWLLVDYDSIHPEGMKDENSTNAEVQACIDMSVKVHAEVLAPAGFQMPIQFSSGNGCGCWYKIDPSCDRALIARVLKALNQYRTDTVKVDTGVDNPSRMTKLPGTIARKFPERDDRPWRACRILQAPDVVEVTPREALEKIAATAPEGEGATDQDIMPDEKLPRQADDGMFSSLRRDIGAWLTENDVPYRDHPKSDDPDSTVYEINCPFKVGAKDGGANIIEAPDGGVTAQCHHDSCQEKDWSDFRRAIDPHTREPQSPPTKRTIRDSEYLARRVYAVMPPAYLYHKNVYFYSGRAWIEQDIDGLKILIRQSLMSIFGDYDGKDKPSIGEGLVTNVLGMFRSIIPAIPNSAKIPCWVDGSPANVLVVRNGIIDLETHKVRRHTKKLFSRFALPYDFDPEMPFPTITKTLEDIFDDPAERELFKEILATMIDSGTNWQKVYLLQGATSGGKSLLTNLATQLVGEENSVPIRARSFNGDFALWNARGKMLIIIPDVSAKKPLPLAFLEALRIISARDRVDVNGKNEKIVNEILSGRILMVSNDIPIIEDESNATQRRFVALKFVHSYYPPEEPLHDPKYTPDAKLIGKLIRELPGFLGEVLKALKRLKANGFTRPASSVQIYKNLLGEGAPIQRYAQERLKKDVTVGASILCGVIYEDYAQWCIEEDVQPLDLQGFGRALRIALPYVERKQKVTEGSDKKPYHYFSVRLKTPAEMKADERKARNKPV